MRGTFRSLQSYNYRVWAAGALVSNVGSWMQRVAQDWIVLTELTQANGTSVGIVMALQFGPQLLLLPLTGFVADHYDRRKILICTQAAMGLLALGLGILVLTGLVQLWQVYLFALLLGCVTAIDSPVRQTFVAELVDERNLPNAVALNATSFNAGRLIGPAVAGVVIAGVGSGWIFLINAATFLAVLCSMRLFRTEELHPSPRALRTRSSFVDGFSYVRRRPDLQTVFFMIFLVATFGLNFPIFISTMAVSVFHAGAGEFGFLTSMMACGSIIGTLMTAARPKPTMKVLCVSAIAFGIGCAAAALMPSYLLFGGALFMIGIAAQTYTTSTNSLVQLATEPAMRGRVIAILLAISWGFALVGSPISGMIADTFGPRWSLGVAALAGFLAALVAVIYFAIHRRDVEYGPTK